jgi:S1-C subfamily serine protease
MTHFGLLLAIAITSLLAANADGAEPTTAPAVGRGYLGVSVGKRRQFYFLSNGTHELPGLMVARIQYDSPASRSELKLGDVIHAVDGRSVGEEEPQRFIDWISSLSPGKVITLTVSHRDDADNVSNVTTPAKIEIAPRVRQPGSLIRITVGNRDTSGPLAKSQGDQKETIQRIELPPFSISCGPLEIRPYVNVFGPAAAMPFPGPISGSGYLGVAMERSRGPLEVSWVFPSRRHWFDTTDFSEVVIKRVVPNSPAGQAGLVPGDRVVALDGRRLSGTDQAAFANMIATQPPGHVVALTVWREGQWPPKVQELRATVGTRPGP